jgi:hypothetical protein
MEDGLDMPEFRSLTSLRRDADFREAAEDVTILLLDVDLPGRTVRVNITMDEGVLRRIDRAAGAAGETRSAFLVTAAKARLADAH